MKSQKYGQIKKQILETFIKQFKSIEIPKKTIQQKFGIMAQKKKNKGKKKNKKTQKFTKKSLIKRSLIKKKKKKFNKQNKMKKKMMIKKYKMKISNQKSYVL